MNRRTALTISFFFSLGFALVAHADPPAEAQDQQRRDPLLDGVWSIASMEQVGRKLEGTELPASMRAMNRIFDKQRMTVKRFEKEYTCTFTVDVDKTPKQMDVTLEIDGREPRTLKCIYEIKGDTLLLAEGKQERPTSFNTDPTMRRIIVYTFKRQEKVD